MRTLDHTETLIYYDGSQLFLAKDQLGTRYICVLISEEDETDSYLCMPSSSKRIQSLILGEADLRKLYLSPETNELYIIESKHYNLHNMEAKNISPKDVPENWLPDSNLFIQIEEPSGIEVVQEAHTRNRAIIYTRLNPPEAIEETKITAEHLSQAVKLIQRLVKHSYKKSLRTVSDLVRRNMADSQNYELEVFAFSEGSFTVHMQSAAPVDLVGYAQIIKAFEIMDSINKLADNPEKAVEKIAEFGGHLASTYKSLFQFISETETGIEYEWSTPEYKTSNRYKITTHQAKPLYDEITKRIDIASEEVVLTGTLSKVDEKYKTWRLKSDEDQKEHLGSSNVDLAGLIIDTRHYEFTCEERLEEEKGTGRELTKLVLKSYKPI